MLGVTVILKSMFPRTGASVTVGTLQCKRVVGGQ